MMNVDNKHKDKKTNYNDISEEDSTKYRQLGTKTQQYETRDRKKSTKCVKNI